MGNVIVLNMGPDQVPTVGLVMTVFPVAKKPRPCDSVLCSRNCGLGTIDWVWLCILLWGFCQFLDHFGSMFCIFSFESL